MARSKYHAKAEYVNGIRFPSRLEAERFRQLLQLERAGEISALKLQVEFQITRAYIDPHSGEKLGGVRYVADFVYVDHASGRTVVEDTKGIETDVFKLKWRLAREQYPFFDWRIVKRDEVIR